MELQFSLLFMKWVEAPVVHFEKHNKSQRSRLLLMPQMSLLLLETSENFVFAMKYVTCGRWIEEYWQLDY